MTDLSHRAGHVLDESQLQLPPLDNHPVRVVVQDHHADRAGKHFDVRIIPEGSDISISFATRHGLPDHSSKPRLLVQQPHHTAEYADFEGSIPQGQYGAGKVRKAWEGEGYASNKDGHLSLTLTKGPITGRFSFIQPESFKGSKGMLVIKHQDIHEGQSPGKLDGNRGDKMAALRPGMFAKLSFSTPPGWWKSSILPAVGSVGGAGLGALLGSLAGGGGATAAMGHMPGNFQDVLALLAGAGPGAVVGGSLGHLAGTHVGSEMASSSYRDAAVNDGLPPTEADQVARRAYWSTMLPHTLMPLGGMAVAPVAAGVMADYSKKG